jgi:hypothetical protein
LTGSSVRVPRPRQQTTLSSSFPFCLGVDVCVCVCACSPAPPWLPAAADPPEVGAIPRAVNDGCGIGQRGLAERDIWRRSGLAGRTYDLAAVVNLQWVDNLASAITAGGRIVSCNWKCEVDGEKQLACDVEILPPLDQDVAAPPPRFTCTVPPSTSCGTSTSRRRGRRTGWTGTSGAGIGVLACGGPPAGDGTRRCRS